MLLDLLHIRKELIEGRATVASALTTVSPNKRVPGKKSAAKTLAKTTAKKAAIKKLSKRGAKKAAKKATEKLANRELKIANAGPLLRQAAFLFTINFSVLAVHRVNRGG
jgi:hypothetical protein